MKKHSTDKPCVCNVCDKIFTTPFLLKQHTRVHTGDRPFKCDVCDKKIAKSSNPKTHMFIHTGEKPFKCTLCERRFTESSAIKNTCHFTPYTRLTSSSNSNVNYVTKRSPHLLV